MRTKPFTSISCALSALLVFSIAANADVTLNKRAMQPIDATVAPNAAATAVTPAAQAPAALPADTALKPMANPVGVGVVPADKALKPMTTPVGTAIKPLTSPAQPNAAGALPQLKAPGANGVGAAAQPMANGKFNLQELMKQPDSTVVEKNGQRITVGQIKANRRALLSKNAPSSSGVMSSKITKASSSKVPAAVLAGTASNGTSKTAIEVAASKGLDVAAAVKQTPEEACQGKSPNIRRVEGDFTPGATVVIRGSCLKNTTGQLKLSRMSQGGTVSLQSNQWDWFKISAQMPANITKIPDETMQLEVTTSDGKISNPVQVPFWAKRELVNVTHLWRKTCQSISYSDAQAYVDDACYDDGINYSEVIDTGFHIAVPEGKTRISSGKHASPTHNVYTITLNAACELNNVWWKLGSGSVSDFKWVNSNIPNQTVVGLMATPSERLEVNWYGDDLYLRAAYKIFADASCPVGVSPNP